MRTGDENRLEAPQVLAAGGVVVDRGQGEPRVALIHRPEYDDWSLPKGKLDYEEGFAAAALREVEEETGLSCLLGRELSPVRYRDRKGRSKLVRFWLMEPLGGTFTPGAEVDELRWLSGDEAIELLSYEHDRRLVREALEGSA